MKMVYLFNHFDVFENKHIGIRRKMQMQMKAFHILGYEPIYIVKDRLRVLTENFITQTTDVDYYVSPKKCNDAVVEKIKHIDPAFIYMRYTVMEEYFQYDLYKELGNTFENVICEFYNYPYDEEWKDIPECLRADKLYRKELHKYFRLSTNFDAHKEIYGIPSIPLCNGFDPEVIRPLPIRKKEGNTFAMIGVALMFSWHGYDRVIEGIHAYYQKGRKKNILFHLVGEGEETEYYKKLVAEYQLEEHVIFHGKIMEMEKLESVFEDSDVAAGSIAIHRMGVDSISTIKATEYCARGIPFFSNEEIAFSENFPYMYHVERADSPLDIESLMDWYQELDIAKVRKEMRTYAEEHLTWEKQFRFVTDFNK